MNTLAATMEDFTPTDTAFVNTGTAIALASPGQAGYRLLKLPTQVKVSSLSSLAFIGKDLSHIVFFPTIDGVTSYYGSSGWAPLPASVPTSQYPSLGMPASALDLALLKKIFTAGEKGFGMALAFDASQVTSPELSGFNLAYFYQPVDTEVSYTRVFGSFPAKHGMTFPSSFSVWLNRGSAAYGKTVVAVPYKTVPVNSDGTWEVYLPDTESMSDPAAAYFFGFIPGNPVARKVPKAVEAPWTSLTVTYS